MQFLPTGQNISSLFVPQCSKLNKSKRLQKAKITIIYSQDIMLDDNTIRLFLFYPFLKQQT